jgi:hypothetical protein
VHSSWIIQLKRKNHIPEFLASRVPTRPQGSTNVFYLVNEYKTFDDKMSEPDCSVKVAEIHLKDPGKQVLKYSGSHPTIVTRLMKKIINVTKHSMSFSTSCLQHSMQNAKL